MTDKNEPEVQDVIEEQIELPEEEVLDDAPPPAAKKKMSPLTKLLIAGTALVVVFGVAFMFNASSTTTGPSSVRAPGAMDTTPGGANQANSPAYQDSVAEMNRLRAERAAELGISSIPTPEVIMRPQEPMEEIGAITKEEEAPVEEAKEEVAELKPARVLPRPPAPPTPPRPPVPAQPKAPSASQGNGGNANAEPKENPYLKSISGMMGQAVTALQPKQMVQGTFTGGVPSQDTMTAQASAGGAGQGPDAGPDYSPENMLLRPGDVLYAETLTSVNSDMRSSVLAEVVHGPHKGARLVGTFEHNIQADRLIVSFTNITFADGRVYDISAMAVDGKSAETAVASDVDRRYISRYAPILASTFISGYAQAKSQPKQTIVGTGDNQQVITEQSSSREAVQAGLAAASGAIAADIAASAPKGPLVELQAGWPIGILIMDRVLIDEPVRPDAPDMGAAVRPYPGMPSQLPPGAYPMPVPGQTR